MIVIIDYKAGNIRSVANAIARLGYAYTISADPETIKAADKVILPGVGNAAAAMTSLQENGLDRLIPTLKQPLLGICLGLQLLCESSEEGNTKGLGVFDAKVLKFPPEDLVPHMGWNGFSSSQSVLTKGIEKEDCYYVHSYYASIGEDTSAVCDYIVPFSALMEKNNFYASQFHPEKSGSVGRKLLENFLAL